MFISKFSILNYVGTIPFRKKLNNKLLSLLFIEEILDRIDRLGKPRAFIANTRELRFIKFSYFIGSNRLQLALLLLSVVIANHPHLPVDNMKWMGLIVLLLICSNKICIIKKIKTVRQLLKCIACTAYCVLNKLIRSRFN